MKAKEAIALGYVQCSHCRKYKPKKDYYPCDNDQLYCSCGNIFHPDWKKIEKEEYKKFMREQK